MATSAARRALAVVELLEKILSHVDLPEELFRVQIVSRRFRDTVRGSKILRRDMGFEQHDSLDPDEPLLHPFLGWTSTREKHKSLDQLDCVCLDARSTAMLNTHPFALTAEGDQASEFSGEGIDITTHTRPWWTVKQVRASSSSAKLVFMTTTSDWRASVGGRMRMGRFCSPRRYRFGSWEGVQIARAKVPVEVIVELDDGKVEWEASMMSEKGDMTLGELVVFVEKAVRRLKRASDGTRLSPFRDMLADLTDWMV